MAKRTIIIDGHDGTDFLITDHGSIVTFKPLTDEAQGWIEEHLVGDDIQWFGGAVVVEPRYVEDIVHGIIMDDLNIKGV